MDGRRVGSNKLREIYKQLGISHVITGHGPSKNIVDVANEARSNVPSYASGRFNTDADVFRAFFQAQAYFRSTGDIEFSLPASSVVGRSFVRRDKIPAGVVPIDDRPFENLPDVVEVPVTEIRVFLRLDGLVRTMFPAPTTP